MWQDRFDIYAEPSDKKWNDLHGTVRELRDTFAEFAQKITDTEAKGTAKHNFNNALQLIQSGLDSVGQRPERAQLVSRILQDNSTGRPTAAQRLEAVENLLSGIPMDAHDHENFEKLLGNTRATLNAAIELIDAVASGQNQGNQR